MLSCALVVVGFSTMAANRGSQGVLQVGPEQLFAGAQRAEADGRLEYAAQLYRQLADAYPTAREAYDARDALLRLSSTAQKPPQFDQHHFQLQTGTAHHGQQLDQHQYAAQPSHNHSHGGWVAQPAHGHLTHGSMGNPIHPTHEHAAPQRREGPRKARPSKPLADPSEPAIGPSYRTGRFVAMMLSSVGWLLLAGSVLCVVILVLALTVGAMPRGLRELAIKQLPLAIGGTTGMLVLGLLSVFAGQLARAVFDTAESLRQSIGRADR